MELLKTEYQWDIGSREQIPEFERESLEVHQQVARATYHRRRITGTERLLNPYTAREEFIEWIRKDRYGFLENHNAEKEWGLIAQLTTVHRNGEPVLAEFREGFKCFLDHLPDPNGGDIPRNGTTSSRVHTTSWKTRTGQSEGTSMGHSLGADAGPGVAGAPGPAPAPSTKNEVRRKMFDGVRYCINPGSGEFWHIERGDDARNDTRP